MNNCEHNKLYMMDFANQPKQYPSCLVCEINSLESKLGEAEERALRLSEDNAEWSRSREEWKRRASAAESKLGAAEKLRADRELYMTQQQLMLESERDELRSRLGKILEVVNAQAEDEGLWAVPIEPGTQNIVEAYLQAELRRLHAVIETIAVERSDPKSSRFDTLLAEQEKHDPDL